MKRLALVFALTLSSIPSFARAQVGVQIHVALPAAPPLVVVQPGVQVVENHEEEIFFTNGWYWVRRDGAWYRARSPRAAFVWVEPRRVPVAIYRTPPGQYRYWRHEQHVARKLEREEAQRREMKEARNEARREAHEREQERRAEQREREHHEHHHE